MEIKWECGHCQDDVNPENEKGKTWGIYTWEHKGTSQKWLYGGSCESCKQQCEQDNNCGGVECTMNLPSSVATSLGSRFDSNLIVFQRNVSCLWRKERASDQCLGMDKRIKTCWKRFGRKYF